MSMTTLREFWDLFLAEPIGWQLFTAGVVGACAFLVLLCIGMFLGARLRYVRDVEEWGDVLWPDSQPERAPVRKANVVDIRDRRAS